MATYPIGPENYLSAAERVSNECLQGNMPQMARWYAVQLKSLVSQHGRAICHLRELCGLELLIPRCREKRTPQLFFSGYIFGHETPQGIMEKTKWVTGVQGPVMFGGNPAPVPDGIIEELRARMDKEGVISVSVYREHSEQIKHIPQGSDVYVMSGPYAGQVGKMQRMKGADRCILLLSAIMNRAASVEVDAGCVDLVRV